MNLESHQLSSDQLKLLPDLEIKLFIEALDKNSGVEELEAIREEYKSF